MLPVTFILNIITPALRCARKIYSCENLAVQINPAKRKERQQNGASFRPDSRIFIEPEKLNCRPARMGLKVCLCSRANSVELQ